MAGGPGTIYPPISIPEDKRYLAGFAWFDYIRPKDKNDLFEWRGKNEKDILKATEKKTVPLQNLKDRSGMGSKPKPKADIIKKED